MVAGLYEIIPLNKGLSVGHGAVERWRLVLAGAHKEKEHLTPYRYSE